MAATSLGTLTVHINADYGNLKRQFKDITAAIQKFGTTVSKIQNKSSKDTEMSQIRTRTSFRKTEEGMGKFTETFKKVGNQYVKTGERMAISTKQSFGMMMKDMLSFRNMAAKIVHYITFSIGVQMVMGIRQGISSLVTSIKEFDKASTNAATVAGYLGGAFDKVKGHIESVSIELGKKTVFSAGQAAEMFYSLASAGYDVSDMFSKDLEPITAYATATNTELDFALQSVTKTMKQFNMDFDEASDVVDTFTTVITNTYATAEKLAEGMKYVGAIAGTLKQDLDQVTASLGILYDRGLEGGQAGQRLNMIFTKLLKPTDKATEILEGLGLTLDEINPRTHDLVSILYTLQAAQFDTADAAGIFRARTAGTASMLVDAADDVAYLTNQIKLSGGITQRVADKQMEALSNRMDVMGNRIGATSLEFRKGLIPAMNFAADVVESIVIPGIQNMANIFSTIVGVLKSFRWVIEPLIPLLMSLATYMIATAVAGKLLLYTLSENTRQVMASITGYNSLGAAMKGLLKSTFLLITSFTILGGIFPQHAGLINTVMVALIALNAARKMHIGLLIIDAQQRLLNMAVQMKQLTVEQALNASTVFRTKAILMAIGAKVKDMVITKAQALWSGILALKNYLLAGSLGAATSAQVAQTGATAAVATAQGIATGTTVALTAATWGWNASLWSNPIILIIAGIVLLAVAAAGLIWIFGQQQKQQEEGIKLTRDEKKAREDLNTTLIDSMDKQWELTEASKALNEAEDKLNDLRSEGKETTEEYTEVLGEHSDAYARHEQAILDASSATEKFLDAGQALVDLFKAHNEKTEDAIVSGYEMIELEYDRTRAQKNSAKSASSREQAMNDYTDAVIKYGINSKEAAQASDDLAAASDGAASVAKELKDINSDLSVKTEEYRNNLKKLNKAERARAEISQKVIEAQWRYLDLQDQRTRLTAQQAVLTRSVSNESKLYEEKLKSVWEMQLKVFEAELALYKLRTDEAPLLDDIFNKLADYGMLNEEIIKLYTDMKQAEADLFVARMDYTDTMLDLDSDQEKAVLAVIEKYKELRSKGVPALDALSQAQSALGIDLSGLGVTTSQINSIYTYAEAEWKMSHATQALGNYWKDTLDSMGGLDALDLPADLKALVSEWTSLGPEISEASTDWETALGDLGNSWKGFVDTSVNVWRGLQDTLDEPLGTTWDEYVKNSDSLSVAATKAGGSFALLSPFINKTKEELNALSGDEKNATQTTLVATAALLEFAAGLGIPLNDISSTDQLLSKIANTLNTDIVGGWSQVEGYTGGLLGDVDPLVQVLGELADVMEDLGNAMYGLKVLGEQEIGIEKDVKTLFNEWTEFQDTDPATLKADLNLEPLEENLPKINAAQEKLDSFNRFLFQTFPPDRAIKLAFEFDASGLAGATKFTEVLTREELTEKFQKKYGKPLGLALSLKIPDEQLNQGYQSVSKLIEWVNGQDAGFEFIIEEAVASEQFKDEWTGNLDEIPAWIDKNDLSVNIVGFIDDQDWAQGYAIMDGKLAPLSQAIQDFNNDPNNNLNITFSITEEQKASGASTLYGEITKKYKGKDMGLFNVFGGLRDFVVEKVANVAQENFGSSYSTSRDTDLEARIAKQKAGVLGEDFDPTSYSNKIKDSLINDLEEFPMASLMKSMPFFGGIIGGALANNAKGGIYTKATAGIFGEAGPEALIPLAGSNKVEGKKLLQNIIPRYFPDLMFAEGAIANDDRSINPPKVRTNDTLSKILNEITIIKNIMFDYISSKIKSQAIATAAGVGVPITGQYLKKAYEGPDPQDMQQAADEITSEASILSDTTNMIEGIFNGIKEGFTGIGDTLESTGSRFMNNLDSAANVFFNAVNNTLQIWANNFDSLSQGTIQTLFSWLVNVFSVFLNRAGQNFVSEVVKATNHIKTQLSNMTVRVYATGHQKGGIYNKPTMGVFGEAGNEALVPLEGKNKKFGSRILSEIIPKYYPELIGNQYQTGGIFGASYGGSTTNTTNEYNDNYTITGPITVTGVQNTQDFMNELKFRARASKRY